MFLPQVSALSTGLFVACTAATAGAFLAAVPKGPARRRVGLFFLGWLLLTGLLAWLGFYAQTNSFPPRMVLVILPPLLAMLALLFLPALQPLRRSLDPGKLTALHTVRIFVEIGLWQLWKAGTVPKMMTFEGINFDIFAGLTAPFVAWLFAERKVLPVWAFKVWNYLALTLVLNVVVRGILSVPGPLQQLNFKEPNIAMLYLPFVWLPALIVPLVLTAHTVCLRNLNEKADSGN